MPHDLFLSYSRKDAPQATELAERFTMSGISVWIDHQGIDMATSWSNEIVQAIDECKAFIVLLSRSSVESDNVRRELSLAFESKKRILPIELEEVVLPTQIRYELAGTQRARLSDFEGILKSIGRFGIASTGNAAAYFKQQFDELSRAHLQCDYIITDLRTQLRTRALALTALAELPHSLASISGFEDMIDHVLDAIHSAFGADRVFGFAQSEASPQVYIPFAIRGYTKDNFPSIPIHLDTHQASMLVNASTPVTPEIEHVRGVIGVPYYVMVPVFEGPRARGLLVMGKMQERYPFAPALSTCDVDSLQIVSSQITTARAIRDSP